MGSAYHISASTSSNFEMSAFSVAPKALVTIAANSALVRFLRGSIVVSLVPTRSPLSTAAVIASSDQLPMGKSTKPSTSAAKPVIGSV